MATETEVPHINSQLLSLFKASLPTPTSIVPANSESRVSPGFDGWTRPHLCPSFITYSALCLSPPVLIEMFYVHSIIHFSTSINFLNLSYNL